jgi:RimJ/RimL family protein N-acetyltransferase
MAGRLASAPAGRLVGDLQMADVALRPVEDGDLDALFEQMRDPEGVWMAAFTPADPDDRNAFDAHMARVRASPEITMRAVLCNGHLAGSIASFPVEGQTEVTYWIDRALWGQGIATRALALLLELAPARPLYARAASDNAGSLRVLQKSGFKAVGTEKSFAAGRGQQIEETILRLDA